MMDRWLLIISILIFAHLFLFTLLKLRPGRLGIYLWNYGPAVIGVLAFGQIVRGLIRFYSQTLFWTPGRGVGFLLLILIILISWKGYRVYPSSYDKKPSQIRFRLPLDGPVTVGWGGSTPANNYHVSAPDQRWAYDLVVTQEGRTHRGEGRNLDDYYIYGRPALSAADGTVLSVVNDQPESKIGTAGKVKNPGGNQVIIQVADKEFLFICHLQPGSIKIVPGDQVSAGDEVGRVGNSGNSSEPHIHIHLQDSPEDYRGEGIPLYFHNYRLENKLIDRGIPTGGFDSEGKIVGQIVEQDGFVETMLAGRGS
jgi:murein DD-endopeptidase MepM/ murein hydrolase activator NlpD